MSVKYPEKHKLPTIPISPIDAGGFKTRTKIRTAFLKCRAEWLAFPLFKSSCISIADRIRVLELLALGEAELKILNSPFIEEKALANTTLSLWIERGRVKSIDQITTELSMIKSCYISESVKSSAWFSEEE